MFRQTERPHSGKETNVTTNLSPQAGATRRGLRRTTTLAFAVLSFALVATSSLFAQCQSNCQYCVEGQCTPRRISWGHYQTNWRRWPEPAPQVQPCPRGNPEDENPDRRTDTSLPDLELPAVDVEADVDPEFERLREKADGNLSSPELSLEVFPSNEYIQDDIMNDEITVEPSSSGELEGSMDGDVNPFDSIMPETPLDLPSPDLEGRMSPPGQPGLQPPTASRQLGRADGLDQPGNTKAAGYFFPSQNSQKRYNPLRGNQPPRQFEQPHHVQPTSAAVRVSSRVAGRPATYQSPLRMNSALPVASNTATSNPLR